MLQTHTETGSEFKKKTLQNWKKISAKVIISIYGSSLGFRLLSVGDLEVR